MRLNQKLALLAVLALAGPACKKETPYVPAPAPTPTPAVVPSHPTPAPTPSGVTPVPELNEYERIRQTPIDEIDRMGLLGAV